MANVFKVEGMQGSECKNKIENQLMKDDNIEHANISLKKNELIVRSDNEFSVADVQEILNNGDLDHTIKDTTFND